MKRVVVARHVWSLINLTFQTRWAVRFCNIRYLPLLLAQHSTCYEPVSFHFPFSFSFITKHPWKESRQSNFVLSELREFFNRRNTNTIEFWECPSKSNWHLHKAVDSDTKLFNLTPLLPNKYSWDFSKKLESDNIINTWKMTFQASDLKGRNFLELVDNDNKPLEPTYCKGGSWLQVFGHSNSLCTRATRAITNHAPIGEYHLKFFLNEDFSCPCGLYPIETRRHILHECRRFNEYWNPRRDSIAHFIEFLERNPRAFSFQSS